MSVAMRDRLAAQLRRVSGGVLVLSDDSEDGDIIEVDEGRQPDGGTGLWWRAHDITDPARVLTYLESLPTIEIGDLEIWDQSDDGTYSADLTAILDGISSADPDPRTRTIPPSTGPTKPQEYDPEFDGFRRN